MGILNRWLAKSPAPPRPARPGLTVEPLEPRSTPATLATPGLPANAPADADASDELVAVSGDGKFVLFASKATNLVVGATDNNSDFDLFWRDLAAGTTKLVTAQAGTLNALGLASSLTATTLSNRAVLSRDGQRVAYVSAASAAAVVGNPSLQDQVATNDVFWWRADTGGAKLVSMRTGVAVAVGNHIGIDALDPVISDDGSFVGYGTTLDAGLIDFSKALDNGNTTYDLFRRDMTLADETRATTTVTRVMGTADVVGKYGGVDRPVGPYMSGDGRFFTFATAVPATVVTTMPDSASTTDVFVRDMAVDTAAGVAVASVNVLGQTIGVTDGVTASAPVISRGGTVVAFASNAPGGTDAKSLVPGFLAGGAPADLYARINPFAAGGTTKLVTGQNGTTAVGGNGFLQLPSATAAASYRLTADGSQAVFVTAATNLVDMTRDRNGAGLDVFARTLATNVTEAVSVGADGKTGSAPSDRPSLTEDGSVVTFVSASPELGAGVTDANAAADVFLRDRTGGVTRAVSTSLTGTATGDAAATAVRISGDGKAAVFVSRAKNLTTATQTANTANLYAVTLPLAPVLGGGAKTLAAGGSPTGQVRTFAIDAAGRLNAAGNPLVPFAGAPTPSRVATGDVNGDGVADLIVAVGSGGGSLVRVVDGQTGNDLVAAVGTYEATFTGGLFVAAADLDRDGKAEVVVSPDVGGGGRIQVFSVGTGGLLLRANFFGIDDTAFRGGARVAVGDVSGDGRPDVVVGAGFGGGPRVAVFDGSRLFDPALAGAAPPKLFNDFFAFPGTDTAQLRNGVFVAVGDVNGDSFGDIVVGGGPGGGPRVYVLSGSLLSKNQLDTAYAQPVANFFAFDSAQRGGVRVAVKDLDGDMQADIVVGSGEKASSAVRTYLSKGLPVGGTGDPPAYEAIDPFGAVLAAGVFVG